MSGAMLEGVVAGAGLFVIGPLAAFLTAVVLRFAAGASSMIEEAQRDPVGFLSWKNAVTQIELPRWVLWVAVAVDLVAMYFLVRFVRWAWQTPMPFIGA